MKTLITGYAFNGTAKTVTFTDASYATVNTERVLLINNATDQEIIYNFADPTKGGTASGSVLTLEYDTSAMSTADELLIYYDDPNATQAISGTLNAGTVDLVKAGTITKLEGGTLGLVSALTTGSIVVTNGTIASSGTVTGVGVVGNINGGSIVVTNGTIATLGTLPNIPGGTIGLVSALTTGSIVVTNGTVASVGTVPGVGIVGNVNAGSIVVTNGTIGTVSNYPLISGEDQVNDVLKTENQYSYFHYLGTTTGTVKSAGGLLHAIVVNTTGTAATTIYDSVGTSATVIGILKAAVAEQSFTYNVECATGISVANTAAVDITVVYR